MELVGICLALALGIWEMYQGIKQVLAADISGESFAASSVKYALVAILFLIIITFLVRWIAPRSWRIALCWGVVIGFILEEIVLKRWFTTRRTQSVATDHDDQLDHE